MSADADEVDAAREVEGVVRWAAGVSTVDIPPAIRRRAVLVLADDLAAAIASRDEPEVAAARATFLRASSGSEASVWDGHGSRADRWTAAVVNAIACDWAELDEGYRLAVCHAGLYALPAAVAEAEAASRTLGDLLTALVVSYEIAARFAAAWVFPPATLHPHGVFSPLGAAAAIGKLRGLAPAELVAAIGGSATLALASPFSHAVKGIPIRNAWPGAGAWLGARAVDLAVAGIGGSAASPFDVYSRALSGSFRAGVLTRDLGRVWAIANGYHKVFACCQYGHSAAEATLALRHRIGTEALALVDSIEVQTHALGMLIDNDVPRSTLAGKFSLQHIVATTLVNDSAGHDAFAAEMLEDQRVAELRRRVRLSPFTPALPAPHDRPARVTVRLRDGRSLTEECLAAQGGPDRPFTDEAIVSKIELLTAAPHPAFASTVRRLLSAPEREMATPFRAILRRLLRPAALTRGRSLVPAG